MRGGTSRVVAVGIVAAAAIVAAHASAAVPPKTTPAQRACLTKSIGASATANYLKGKPVAAKLQAKVRACIATKAVATAASAPVAPPAAAGVPIAAGAVAAAVSPSAPCAQLDATGVYLTEGPASARDARETLRSTGAFRATVIFVDFVDAPGTTNPSVIAADWVAGGARWLEDNAYGRASISLQTHPHWLRMSRPADSYGFVRGFSWEKHRDYIKEAVALADPTVDFRGTDIVYVVASPTSAISFSPTFRASAGTLSADGHALGPAVTFGLDAYGYGKTILPHETGHLMGLPDLYAHTGDVHRFVGIWDYMGNTFEASELTAWHRFKLGWIDGSQVACAASGATSTATLSPLWATGGVKMAIVKTSPTRLVVVENRQRGGNDAQICDTGALVYSVDATVKSGEGPIRVAGDDVAREGCARKSRSDTPLHVGESISIDGVTVTVTGGTAAALQVLIVAT